MAYMSAQRALVLDADEWQHIVGLVFDRTGKRVPEVSQVVTAWAQPFEIYGDPQFLATLKQLVEEA